MGQSRGALLDSGADAEFGGDDETTGLRPNERPGPSRRDDCIQAIAAARAPHSPTEAALPRRHRKDRSSPTSRPSRQPANHRSGCRVARSVRAWCTAIVGTFR
jgi:hypothetical protein